MQGLELAERYFEAFGKPMLDQEFPGLLSRVAVGLAGSGSECLGFDDAISRDHDFEPGFCIFLPGEDQVDRRTAFLLERAYDKLPREFVGFTRARIRPVGGLRHGVIRLSDFLTEKLGVPDGRLSTDHWLLLSDQSLLEVTNGRIFSDQSGLFEGIRKRLAFYPEEIRCKKLAGHLLMMAQSGQYNYRRCLDHGETAAAQLAACEFVHHAMRVIFLLNRVYQPYYKWSFRALRALPLLSLEAELFEYLLTTDNEEGMREEKYRVMEGISSDIIGVLRDQDLTRADCGDLEKHAYSLNDRIDDGGLRNRHILTAV